MAAAKRARGINLKGGKEMDEKIDNKRIDAVSGFCSWCGKMPPGGCEVGIIDENDVPQAFCNYDCLGNYNLSRGFPPDGEILMGASLDVDLPVGVSKILPWPADVKCPTCNSTDHDSKFVAYFSEYNEREYQCKSCGYYWVSLTK
jgi:hypothetical protein